MRRAVLYARRAIRGTRRVGDHEADGCHHQPATRGVRIAEASCRSFATGLILNQMVYKAGKNTSVRTVPPKVPPIKVYASVPQNTDWVSGMNASMAASAVRMTGR